jgi:hypothetical protein
MVAMKRRAWLFSILTLVFFIGAALIMGARVSDAERANGQMVPVVEGHCPSEHPDRGFA